MKSVMEEVKCTKIKRVFEEDLQEFLDTHIVISQSFYRDVKFFEKGGTLKTRKQYLVSYTYYSPISYEELVNSLIREKYSESEEFAIIRKKMAGINTEEFDAYNEFAEQCKVTAKQFVLERTENEINAK